MMMMLMMMMIMMSMMMIMMIVMMMMMMPEWDNSSGKERRHISGNGLLLSKLHARLGFLFFIMIRMITLMLDQNRKSSLRVVCLMSSKFL